MIGALRTTGARRATAAAAMALFLLAGAGRSEAEETTTRPESNLEPGDAIAVHSWREPELSGQYPVDESGVVILPLIGARTVTGMSAAQLKREAMRDYAKQLQSEEIRVELLRRVGVVGAVRSPGLYHVDPTVGVAEAVALAGGPTEDGKDREVEIRRGTQEFRVYLDRDPRSAGPFRSGDTVIIPRRSWFSRNSGILAGALISASAIVVAATTRN